MAGMNMQQMMKQARKMQEQLAAAEDNIKIDPDACDPEDVEMLQDMIMAAVNEAIRSVGELANKQMGAITGGLNIPGMPF